MIFQSGWRCSGWKASLTGKSIQALMQRTKLIVVPFLMLRVVGVQESIAFKLKVSQLQPSIESWIFIRL
jgi:hypothetical protein